MLACIGGGINRPFNTNDRIALVTLYGAPISVSLTNPNPPTCTPVISFKQGVNTIVTKSYPAPGPMYVPSGTYTVTISNTLGIAFTASILAGYSTQSGVNLTWNNVVIPGSGRAVVSLISINH